MKVLLPIDESPCSEKTVQWAAHTFDKATTEYHILMVVSLPAGYIPAVPEFVGIIPDPEILESESSAALATIRNAKNVLESLGCKVYKFEFIVGNTVDEICKYADEWNIDQVVMGSHGKTGFQKFMMGSVSSDVMKYCKKPVLVYRNLQPAEQLVFN